jgi:CheY-like chemotaxis protein
VSDGKAAVDLCRKVAPETVLLDLDMPQIDGFETARRIRAAECTKRIVALTGRATEEARRKAEAAGFDELLSKPISTPVLMRALFPRSHE